MNIENLLGPAIVAIICSTIVHFVSEALKKEVDWYRAFQRSFYQALGIIIMLLIVVNMATNK